MSKGRGVEEMGETYFMSICDISESGCFSKLATYIIKLFRLR